MKFSLRRLLVLAFMVQAIGVASLIGYFSYRSRRAAVMDLADHLMRQTAERVYDRLDGMLIESHHFLELVEQDIERGRVNPQNFAALETFFFDGLKSHQQSTAIGYANAAGEILLVSWDYDGYVAKAGSWVVGEKRLNPSRPYQWYELNENGDRVRALYPVPNYDPRQTNWYQTAVEKGGPTWTPNQPLELAPIASTFAARPIYQSDRLQGVVFSVVPLQVLGLFLNQLDFSPQGQAFILDRAGNLVATSTGEVSHSISVSADDLKLVQEKAKDSRDPLTRATAQAILNQFETLKTVQRESFSFVDSLPGAEGQVNRQRYFVHTHPYSDQFGLDWLIVTVVPESDFAEQVNAGLRRTIVLCVLSIAGAIGLGVWLARLLSRPLQQLNASLGKLSLGEVLDPPATRLKEVSDLAEVFNRMTSHLSISWQALVDSQELFATLLDSMPVGVCVFNPQGEVILVNRKSKEMIGPELRGVTLANMMNYYQFYYADSDRPYPMDQIPVARAFQGEAAHADDLDLVHQGRRIPLEIQALPVLDAAGQIRYVIDSCHDITTRREADRLQNQYSQELERQIAERTAELDTILENVPVVIIKKRLYADGRMVIEHVSGNRYEEIFGLPVEETIENIEKWSSRVFPDDLAAIVVPGMDLQNRPPLHTIEFRYQHPNGDLRWIYSVQAIHWDEASQSTQVFIVESDITDRKRAELELQKAKEAAEAGNRAKSTFIANISHELRSPLNAILGFARLLKNDSDLSTTQQEKAAIIERSGSHLLAMINQVLDLARSEADRVTLVPNTFNLSQFLDELYDLFRLRASEKQLILTFQAAPDLPDCLNTDETKLRQVLINLLDNAMKFTAEGSITLQVEQVLPAPVPQLTSVQNSSARLRFAIIDTGSGVAPAEQEMLFQPFSQTETGRSLNQGLGLGLVISQELVRLMGGEIQVESNLGRGSTFWFEIQAETVTQTARPLKAELGQIVGLAPGQPRYRVLIADDNGINRRLLVETLSILDIDLREVADGRAAVEQWQIWQPDLILMDLWMPVLDGYEATAQIRDLEAAQPRSGRSATVIIGVSATGVDDHRSRAIAVGCNGFILKPLTDADLFGTLAEHLNMQYSFTRGNLVDTGAQRETVDLSEMIAGLPQESRDALEQAVILGDRNQLQLALRSIKSSNPDLAQRIEKMADRLQYLEILNLIMP